MTRYVLIQSCIAQYPAIAPLTDIRLYINGVDATRYLKMDTLVINDTVNRRSTLRLTLVGDYGSLPVLVDGTPVAVTGDGYILFAGFVQPGVETRILSYQSGIVEVRAEAADYHVIADRRLYSRSWLDTTVEDIVADIVGVLSEEGVTLGGVVSGYNVKEAVFNVSPVSDVLDELASRCDAIWYIDYDKKLYMVERTSEAAPWTITASDVLSDASIVRGNERYRNKVVVRNARDITNTQVESFKGDGSSRTFVVGYPLAKEPSITVDGVSKTVGIRGVETGKDWYWNMDDNTITQDSAAAPLSSSQTLTVSYNGYVYTVVNTWDPGAIMARQALEGGGSGMVEVAEDCQVLSEAASYMEYANALLHQYCRDATKLTLSTLRPGLEAGLLANVDLPILGAVGEYLVESVEITAKSVLVDGAASYRPLYRAVLVQGPVSMSWTSFFKGLYDRTRVLTLATNTGQRNMSLVSRTYSETVSFSDAETTTVYACPVVYADGDPGQFVVRGDSDGLQKKSC